MVSSGSAFAYVEQKGSTAARGGRKKIGDREEREPVPGNKVWHPLADQSVYLWHVACENCDVFEIKSTKVLSDDIRMTG